MILLRDIWLATVCLWMTFSVLATTVSAAETTISKAVKQPNGLLVHSVKSPYQAGKTSVSVLLPDQHDEKSKRKYRVLYVLPVERQDNKAWGDSVKEVLKTNLHNKYNLICVFPAFSHLPWYADHPTNPLIRQETYFVKTVVPFIDRTYPVVKKRSGRLLVGFSKSGWGAFTLLLRHPRLFERAAAWDAPLMEAEPKKYGMGPIFGDQKNFEKYHIRKLLQRRAKDLSKKTRLIHLGYDNFRKHHVDAEKLMKEL